MGQLIIEVETYTGKHILYYLLSPKRQAKRIAKKLLKNVWKEMDPTNSDLFVKVPGGCFKILDKKGNVKPSTSPDNQLSI